MTSSEGRQAAQCFFDYEQSTTKQQVKDEKFLSKMEFMLPWQASIALLEPYQPKPAARVIALASAYHHAAHPPAAAVIFAMRSSVGIG